MRKIVTTTLVPLALFGCVVEEELPTSTTSSNIVSDNGASLNGASLNGASLNGASLNGASLNGASLNGASLNGASLNGASLNGASLNGASLNGNMIGAYTAGGTPITGTELVGAELTGTLSSGASLTLRIDSMTQLSADTWAYGVSFEHDGGWSSYCGTDANGAIEAIPVGGVWNQDFGSAGGGSWSDDGTQFTFACRHASIAKCVELGYEPWKGYGDELLSCVRMLRADYCGDGISYTVNGTLINVYDGVGIQTDTESWPVDATWTPDGAGCLNHHRGGSQPACYAEKYSATCGGFSGGNDLVSEYNG